MTEKYAVLTGDVIRSKKMAPEQLEAVRRRIAWAAGMAGKRWEGAVVGQVDFYRGDGWQMLLTRPELALRAALMIRTSLIAFEDADSRTAIGIGPVEQINREHISQSSGPAFELSGKALDGMKKRRYLDLKSHKQDHLNPDFLSVAIQLCDSLVQRLSPRQAECVFWAIQEYKQEEIARKLQPTVQQHTVAEYLNNSGWEGINRLINLNIV